MDEPPFDEQARSNVPWYIRPFVPRTVLHQEQLADANDPDPPKVLSYPLVALSTALAVAMAVALAWFCVALLITAAWNLGADRVCPDIQYNVTCTTVCCGYNITA